MTMQFNLRELIRRARQLDRDDHRAGDVAKLGNLRAGSSGMMNEDGDIAGACHRKSHLRQLGIEIEEPTEDKLIMFELGFAHEDVVLNQLKQSLPEGYVMLIEEEIPIEWRTKNGTNVSGRPDIVVCKSVTDIEYNPEKTTILENDQKGFAEVKFRGETPNIIYKTLPVLGLELKSVHSLWVAREVLFAEKPKTDNLIQAAHYMWRLSEQNRANGIPQHESDVAYKLMYKNYSQLGQGMAGNEWIVKQFPRPGELGSEYIDYTRKESKKTGEIVHTIKHIKQFEIVYDLQFDSKGVLQYRVEGRDSWISTIIERDDIERYFEYVSTMAEKKQLGPRPVSVAANGEKLNYTACQYCPLQAVCDSSEQLGYAEWLKQVRNTTAQLNNNNKTQVLQINTDKTS